MANKARDFVARFLSDTSKFDTDEPVKELDNLADAADTTSRRMDDSFERVRKSSTDNLDRIGQEGHPRAASIGAEIGDELAENMGEAMRSGDIGSFLTESLTSLAPALGAAGIGIGIGAAVITNMVKGMNAGKERFQAATQRVIDSVDVDLSTFTAKLDTSTLLEKAMEGLTTGDIVADSKEFDRLATKIKGGRDALVRVLTGQATPQDKAAIQDLAAAAKTANEDIGTLNSQAMTDWQTLTNLTKDNEQAVKDVAAAYETVIDAQKRAQGEVRTTTVLLNDQSRAALGAFAGKALPTDDR